MGKPCTFCESAYHTAFSCPSKPRAPMRTNVGLRISKPMKRIGKQGLRYKEFRDTVAYPYLVAKFGEKCAICGTPGKNLDVDHILKRGSHPELKYDLNNLQLLCRACHSKKDNG